MPNIQVLDRHVAELIAAGEVIENPASIVKELIENAIDAGATTITVEITNGGTDFIRVSDNGCGIEPKDVPTAFLRHATSKVKDEHDLESIHTLGFRGEALASICAVARVEMMTRRAGDSFGTRISLEGGEQTDLSEAGCPEGTTIIIRDLFYNTPARQKFLKKNKSEGNAVSTVIVKTALGNPQIAFHFIRDNRQEITTPGDGKLLSAIYSVLGRDFAKDLLPVQYEYQGVRIEGFSSIPIMSRANRTMQHFFVNGRYVKVRTASVAVEEAYKNSIMIGRFPACVLNIELPCDMVDVNVHPAKTEVRFANEHLIFDSLFFAVKSALAQFDSVGNELKQEAQIQAFAQSQRKTSGEQTTLSSTGRFTQSESTAASHESPIFPGVPSVQIVYEDDTPVSSQDGAMSKVNDPGYTVYTAEREDDFQVRSAFKYINQDAIKPRALEEEEKAEKESKSLAERLDHVKIVGEIFKTYIIAEVDDEMVLVDKHAAHERIIFEEIRDHGKSFDKQVLLKPLTLAFSNEEYEALTENMEELSRLGFTVEDCDNNTLSVREVPLMLDRFDSSQILNEIACNMSKLQHNVNPQVLEDLYHSIACKAAIKANDKNDIVELVMLVERIFSDPNIRYCPHGRPVMLTYDKRKLDKQFGRIQ